ncbi:MAG TPA: inorganic diphosphatase [Gemmatimonadaceae bacterium]|jgi:inorganic pyrophosphatase|nr:inorganic diphosphatase [Gemmatimonadaceae bacterium]
MSYARLKPYDRKRTAYLGIVEAVRGSRNKFKFDPAQQLFIHDGLLPTGASYPFDFGFVPGTRGDDGDPIDVLLLMDEPAFVGAVVPFRLIGAIEAEQRESDGDVVRNDRLLGVACKSETYRDVEELDDLPAVLLERVEHFWIAYNEIKGKRFRVVGRADAKRATRLVRAARRS